VFATNQPDVNMGDLASDFFMEAWFESQAERQLSQRHYDPGMTHPALSSQIFPVMGMSHPPIAKVAQYDPTFVPHGLGLPQVSPTLVNAVISPRESISSSASKSSRVSPRTSLSSFSTIDPFLLALSGSSPASLLQTPPDTYPPLFSNPGADLASQAVSFDTVDVSASHDDLTDRKRLGSAIPLKPKTPSLPRVASETGKKFISPRRREMHNKSATRSRSRLNATIEKMFMSIPEGYRRQLRAITLSESKYKKTLSRADKSEIVIGYMRFLEGELDRERRRPGKG
jgi:hypothetical protein